MQTTTTSTNGHKRSMQATKKSKRGQLPRPGTFGEFIMSLPETMPRDEVLRLGRRAGLTFSVATVSSTRWKYRAAVAAAGGVTWRGKGGQLQPAAAPAAAPPAPRLRTVPTTPPKLASGGTPRLRTTPPTMDPAYMAKHSPYVRQLRQLVLRMGFDAAAAVFADMQTTLDVED
jgi:hypothetical protein